MKLLLDDIGIPFSPKLAALIGTKEALFLRQLDYRLQISKNIKAGHRWVYNTYEDWAEVFPCWSVSTIKRVVRKLEDKGFIVTSAYNKMPMDKTKWYRIDYAKIPALSEGTKVDDETDQHVTSDRVIPVRAITKEPKQTTKNKIYSENDLAVISSTVEYLNEKAAKRFKHTTAATKKIIHALIEEGYTPEDFKRVIDTKTTQWLTDPKMCNYLQPSTLFKADKFENYLNETSAVAAHSIQSDVYKAPELDFGKGENPYEL